MGEHHGTVSKPEQVAGGGHGHRVPAGGIAEEESR